MERRREAPLHLLGEPAERRAEEGVTATSVAGGGAAAVSLDLGGEILTLTGSPVGEAAELTRLRIRS